MKSIHRQEEGLLKPQHADVLSENTISISNRDKQFTHPLWKIDLIQRHLRKLKNQQPQSYSHLAPQWRV